MSTTLTLYEELLNYRLDSYSYSGFIKNQATDVYKNISTEERTKVSIKHNIRPDITT